MIDLLKFLFLLARLNSHDRDIVLACMEEVEAKDQLARVRSYFDSLSDTDKDHAEKIIRLMARANIWTSKRRQGKLDMTTRAFRIVKAALKCKDVHSMPAAFDKITELAKGNKKLEVDAACKLMSAFGEFCIRQYYAEQERQNNQ